MCVCVCEWERGRDLQSGSNGPPSSSWREVVSLTWQERIRETWQWELRERNAPFPALTVNTLTITLSLLLHLLYFSLGLRLCREHITLLNISRKYKWYHPHTIVHCVQVFFFWTRLYRLHLSEGAQISPSSYPGTRLNSSTCCMWVQADLCFSMSSENL